jgi:hypothetical protein
VLGAEPAAAACRLALALGFDVSRSVSVEDYAIQREGLLAALAAPEIRSAFLRPRDPVALAVYEWSGAGHQEIVVDWVLVRDQATLDAVAALVAGHARGETRLSTALGGALQFGRDLLARMPDCEAWTLDLSGDGRNNEGADPARVYAREDFGDVTVNGLAIGGHERDIALYFGAEVIRGPGAFVEVAALHEDFPRAIRRKLERELTERLFGAVQP